MAKNRIVFSNDFVLDNEKIGINTSSPKATLNVVGDVYFSGVTTSLNGFVGDLIGDVTGNLTGDVTGNLTGIASTAKQLENARTFEITGDVVASPIAFDGTGNVSLAATIQPNSVGLGTDTFGDYVKDISGTANEIVVTGGTGESSTPAISIAPNPTIGGNVVIGNDLQINNNLNINGTITVGGTTAIVYAEEFRVSDKDIVLGFTTDLSGNEVSTDTTANGGGIAIASTEGSPLVCLQCAGINTFPGTYKQLIWYKAGAFSGLNTDAWLSNYAIGIGSTQVPNDVRLAAGAVQFTDTDIIQVRNINASGIVTAPLFDSTDLISTNLYVSGISTLGKLEVSSGVLTATSGIVTYYGDGQYLQNLPTPAVLIEENTGNKSQYVSFQVSTGSTTKIQVSTNNFVFNPSTVRLGIGTDDPVSNLDVNGDCNISGVVTAIDFNSTSDENLKVNIETINNALDVVNNLRGVSFDWKSSGKGSYGVIAQEVERILPNIVSNTDPKTVNYNGIIGLLIEAIKDLSNQVKELKSTNNKKS